MALETKLYQKLSQQLVMTPQLRQAIKILQVSRAELETLIDEEIAENPVLEETSSQVEEEEQPHDRARHAPKPIRRRRAGRRPVSNARPPTSSSPNDRPAARSTGRNTSTTTATTGTAHRRRQPDYDDEKRPAMENTLVRRRR